MPGGGIAVRWLGIVLVLTGAAGGFILARRQSLIPLRLAQALLVDLGVLVSHVCTARRPLPEILAADLAGGLGGRWMWRPLLVLLDREEGRSFGDCWAQAAGGLPPPLDGMLSHLGEEIKKYGSKVFFLYKGSYTKTMGIYNLVMQAAVRQSTAPRLLPRELCLMLLYGILCWERRPLKKAFP